MSILTKLFAKHLSKILNKKNKLSDSQKEEEIKKYWKNIHKNIDEPMGMYIWNKNIKVNDEFQKNDFTEYALYLIDQELELIKHHSVARSEADQQNIKLNILFLTIYSYATSTVFIDGFIFYLVLLFLSYAICYLWHHTIKSCFMQNAGSFAVIRQCQEYLPMKAFGEATIKLMQHNSNTHHHPGFFASMLLAKIFAGLYTLVFVFYLLNTFFK